MPTWMLFRYLLALALILQFKYDLMLLTLDTFHFFVGIAERFISPS